MSGGASGTTGGGGAPRISVLIVNYNAGDLLLRCLESLRGDRSPWPKEVIVADNASRDGSAARAAERHPEARFILLERNLGFAGGVSRAAAAASGEFLFLLNPDAEVFPDTLERLVRGMESDPALAVAGCKIYEPDGRTLQHAGGVIHPNLITSHRGRGDLDAGQVDEPADADYVTGAALAVRRDLFHELGGLDAGYRPGYNEETELCLRARRRGLRVVCLPAARVVHHESSASGKQSPRFFYAYHRNRLRFLLRNHSPAHWVARFAPAELRWIRRGLPREQRLPLLRAYLVNLLRLPLTLVGR